VTRGKAGARGHGGSPCTLENREREHIETTLVDFGGNLRRTARILGVTRQNLEHRIRRLGARRPPALARREPARPAAKVGKR